MIDQTMNGIVYIRGLDGTLTWREEVIDRAGRVVEHSTGTGDSFDAEGAWMRRIRQCRLSRSAYACRLVILDVG
jgi:hypothetical protein